MTDEELLAEEYICNGKCQDDITRNYVHCKTCTRLNDFLAGLKAGRPKWHNLRKNPDDLPKRDERFSTNISIAVMTQDNNFAFYCFDDKKWYFQGVEIGNVVAWCEIPKFEG